MAKSKDTKNEDPVARHREASKAYHAKMRALPPAKREAIKIGNLAERVDVFVSALGEWRDLPTTVIESLEAGAEALREAQEKLDTLPDDYQPIEKKRRRRKGDIEIGAVVRVRDKVRGQYEGATEEGELDDLTVIALRDRGKVRCRTKGGDGLFYPRTHLEVTAPAEA